MTFLTAQFIALISILFDIYKASPPCFFIFISMVYILSIFLLLTYTYLYIQGVSCRHHIVGNFMIFAFFTWGLTFSMIIRMIRFTFPFNVITDIVEFRATVLLFVSICPINPLFIFFCILLDSLF